VRKDDVSKFVTNETENRVGIIKVIGDKVEYHTEGIKIY